MKDAYTVGGIFQRLAIGGRQIGIRTLNFLRRHAQAIGTYPNTIKSPRQPLKRLITLPSDGIQNRPDRFFDFCILLCSPVTDVLNGL
jgi:hypothetical protein